ncbi:MAG: GntR family transcriptional regulator [Rhodoblastus sp.]|nr:MAG: GntR family transcriptional regulator [Rhodoblastus sp.]
MANLVELRCDDALGLQAQIRRAIVAAIRGGRLAADSPVPSSRILAEHLNVARNTVTVTYRQLIDEGYRFAKQQSGYFVSAGLANPDAIGAETTSSPERGHYNSLLREIAGAHRSALQDALRKRIPAVDFVPVLGGASCWVSGPPWLDARALAREAFEKGVMIEPDDVHFVADAAPMTHFRLGFSSIARARIEPGVQALASLAEAQRSR